MKSFINGMLLLAFFLLLVGGGTAVAKVYKYVDSAGQIHYTNDPVAIPPEYQNQLEIQDEVKAPPPDAKSPEEPSSEATADNAKDPNSVEQQLKDYGLDKIETFRAQERAFDQEYSRLLKEREALTASQEAVDTAAGVLENNRRVDELNNKFVDFHKRQKEFRQRVDAYNRQVKENMRKKVQQLDSLEQQDDTAAKTPEETPAQK